MPASRHDDEHTALRGHATSRPAIEQGSRGHDLLLDHQDPLHHGGRDRSRLAILFTFALGTAAGDLLSEKLSLGYLVATLIFGAAIALVAISHFALKVNAALTFWIAYILTRPFGASIGDYLSQARSDGGLGLGTVVTSALFLVTILALVIYLAVSRTDQSPASGRHNRA